VTELGDAGQIANRSKSAVIASTDPALLKSSAVRIREMRETCHETMVEECSVAAVMVQTGRVDYLVASMTGKLRISLSTAHRRRQLYKMPLMRG
jgi:hypothetical protein